MNMFTIMTIRALNRSSIKNLPGLLLLFLWISSSAQDKADTIDKKESHPGSFIKVAANPDLRGNALKKFLDGRNYRNEWTEPVQMPVFNFHAGGFTPEKEGGGKETRSLRIKDTADQKWTLRSVEKFPENAIPLPLRKTLTAKLVVDGISASYPYGVLSMGVLSKAAHVPYFKNKLVYVADDAGLGEYKNKYKDLVMLMEEREPSGFSEDKADNPKKENNETISTEEVVYKLAESHSNRTDQRSILNARLLDNFVMDFDRHEGQWEWVAAGSGEQKVYYPVPKDRDQVFYTSQGLLLKFVRGKSAIPELEGFKKRAKNINTFNRPEQNFDHYFLNQLSEDDWSKQIDVFIHSMTDAVIDSALHQQPVEIQKYSTRTISKTLKAKRKYFKADMMRYYQFLSRTVSIVGSNQREQFFITKNENGTISIKINAIDSLGNLSSEIYNRIFDPSVTKEIRIYGLEGNDKFVVQGGASKIKVRLIGGPGDDEFIGESDGKNVLAYDVNFEQNSFSGNGIRKHVSRDPQNNNYTRLDHRYNLASPGISLEYSTDGGLFIGPKFKVITHGFRKDPYSMQQLLAVNRAINSASYHIKYNVDIIKLFGNNDLVLRTDLKLPTSRTLFFGMGNNTVFDKTKTGDHKYYFDRYELINISLLLRNNITSWFQVRYGPIYQYFKQREKENIGKYISNSTITDQASYYAGHSFAGGEFALEINTKNHAIIPTRGIDFNVYNRVLGALNHFDHSVNETGGYLTLYTDFISKKHVVLATSFGASHITGNFALEQAQYLGFKQNLRGFRIDRFAGRSRAYNNSEVRINMGDANLGLFRGAFGFLAFNDVGRVWADNEKSNTWHDGYGGGIWLAPFNRFLLTASTTYSKEEKNLLLITFGFQF
jgi:hypothetical protein